MVTAQEYASESQFKDMGQRVHLLPYKIKCPHCGLEIEADYFLDVGRWLHLSAACSCGEDDSWGSPYVFDKQISELFLPFEDTRYDYTIRKSAARPALIAEPGLRCEKCQADAVGTFNVIKELEVETGDGRYPDYIFERVSGPHHRCPEHVMLIDENIVPFKGWSCE